MVQSEVDVARLGPSAISFAPQAVSVGVSTNVRIELDTSSLATAAGAVDIDLYNLYRLDSETRTIVGPALVQLVNDDPGTATGTEVFSSTLAVRSTTAGESFSYVAHPEIAGAEDRDAGLSIIALGALRSFSSASGLGFVASNSTTTTVPAITNEMMLRVQYTWPLDQSDLDTSTIFLDASVGTFCSSSATYMTFSGDDTSTGGEEIVTIQLQQALADGAWSGSTKLEFRTGWYLGNASGPATLRVLLEDKSGSVVGDVLEVAVSPQGLAPGEGLEPCDDGPISATLDIDVGANVKLTLSI